MKAEAAAKAAVKSVQEIMSRCTDNERATYEAFDEEFDALIEGWKMRLEELEEMDDEDSEDE